MDKNSLKDRAKAHWTGRGTRSIDVPEWGATIFYRTPNLAIIKAVMEESKGDTIEAQARIVVACAMDDSDERIWSKPEYKDLMTSVDPAIVARLATAIMADGSLDLSPKDMAADEKN
jgi:hypothetical protein